MRRKYPAKLRYKRPGYLPEDVQLSDIPSSPTYINDMVVEIFPDKDKKKEHTRRIKTRSQTKLESIRQAIKTALTTKRQPLARPSVFDVFNIPRLTAPDTSSSQESSTSTLSSYVSSCGSATSLVAVPVEGTSSRKKEEGPPLFEVKKIDGRYETVPVMIELARFKQLELERLSKLRPKNEDTPLEKALEAIADGPSTARSIPTVQSDRAAMLRKTPWQMMEDQIAKENPPLALPQPKNNLEARALALAEQAWEKARADFPHYFVNVVTSDGPPTVVKYSNPNENEGRTVIRADSTLEKHDDS